ncbi:MAG: hypothetical protein A2289_20225 [Deltaproteobacteria bacterium RIFOXYA12_FULL_58_15]|nr:MAG: hypothetical protein A2289_20225 [Deltaproteobacteria bacterium RIFOXYA12_FULL_58_15]OGR07195.1 MAG: hypothetical protein A2341_03525 [Deltaproteobacteria bacterium RIFOXYB12_FULL_58_9]
MLALIHGGCLSQSELEVDGQRLFDPIGGLGYPIGVNRIEFLAEFQGLARRYEDDAPSTGCINSTNVMSCAACMFSENLRNCYKCTHCKDSSNCSNLSHSSGCQSCHASAYLTDSRFCTGSAYLVNCVSCSDCTYCLGCVGLVKKDFHVLNVPYSRKEYFATLKQLKRELGIR